MLTLLKSIFKTSKQRTEKAFYSVFFTQEALDIPFKKLNENALLPIRSRPGDACIDIFALDFFTIPPRSALKVGTGISVELPMWHEMRIRGRSGNTSEGLWCFHGTIDSNYRGEIIIILKNDTDTPYNSKTKNQRIAQAQVCPVLQFNPVWAEYLSETERGEKGFGSSGY